jgi:23S rRNA (guanosine2251-2'-O)-methyltransferase
LKNSGIKVIAATEKAAELYTDIDMSVPVAILMGSEDVGISTEHLRISDELVRLPQIGNIKSLNVSVAAGVMIYEVLRQRKS